MLATLWIGRTLVPLVALGVLLVPFLVFDLLPDLGAFREEVRGVGEPELRCIQGFCEEVSPAPPIIERWWRTSILYFRIVAMAMLMAALVGASTEVLLSKTHSYKGTTGLRRMWFPRWDPPPQTSKRTPVTLDFPGVVVAVLVLGPLVGISRLVLAVFATLVVGPVLFRLISSSSRKQKTDTHSELAVPTIEASWSIVQELREWLLVSRQHILAMVFIVFVTSILAGPILDLVSEQTMAEVAGDDATGVIMVATVGLLVGSRLLLAVPAIMLLVVIGMGVAPASTLLFVAMVPGRVGFQKLLRFRSRSRETGLAATMWVVAISGGLALLHLAALFETDISDARPSITTQSAIFMDVTDRSATGFLHNRREEMFPFGGGVVIFDFNNDGFDDIFVANSDGPNALYRNNGDTTFTEVAVLAGVDDPLGRGNGGCVADYDNDGDRDIYLTNYGPSRLFSNGGSGVFTEVTMQSGLKDPSSGSHEDSVDLDVKRSMGCAWGDFNADGFVDLIVARHLHEYKAMAMTNRDFYERTGGLVLFRNNGDGTFVDLTSLLGETDRSRSIVSGNQVPEGENLQDTDVVTGAQFGEIWGAGFQPGWADFDNDGDLDLYVVNDLGPHIHPNVLWRNDGLGIDGEWVFSNVSIESNANLSIDGMSLAVADYDKDGSLDIFMTNIGDNVLLRHDGQGLSFKDVSQQAGVTVGKIGDEVRVAWGAVFFDFDNDMDEDLYVVSGHLDFGAEINPEEQRNVLLRNDEGIFRDLSNISGADDPGVGRGVAYLDFNGDGCLDLFVTNYGQRSKLLRNSCDTGNTWLVIQPVGTVSNWDGIGARISVVAGGVRQIREITSGSSQMGQNMLAAHFGLGMEQRAEKVTIRWPSGSETTIMDVELNQRVAVTEPR